MRSEKETVIGKWQALVIDCEDPDALAGFYQELLGMIRVQEEDEFISIGDAADRPAVAFQRVERLVRPQWPDADHPQQMHVDVLVDDLDAGEAAVLRLGAAASTPARKPSGSRGPQRAPVLPGLVVSRRVTRRTPVRPGWKRAGAPGGLR